MAKEELVQKLHELYEKAENLVKAYNEANQTGALADAVKASKDLEEVIGDYTNTARTIVFDECAATEDPMLEAVKRLSFQTIAVKDDKAEGTEIPVRIIVEKEKQIDLLKLHKYITGGIGADKNWPYMIEKFNMLLTARKAEELGIDPTSINDSYAMSEIARGFDLGKNPASKTKILDTLRNIVGAMVGEEFMPNVNSHDVAFLLSVYSKKSRKALTVTCANHKFMRGYVMEICHRVVTGKVYDVEYRTAK